MCANSEGTDETAQIHLCDKYHNLMSLGKMDIATIGIIAANNIGADQTAWMFRTICNFAARTCCKSFVMR